MGKGSSGGSTQTSSTAYNTNIPEYAQPYVTSMLNATQQQLFNVQNGQVTGFAPYRAYGGTYDQAGNMTAYNPAAGIAGFTPMQQQVQENVANLQTPTQFGVGSDYAAAAGEGALGTTGAAMGYGRTGQTYGTQGAQIGQGALGYGGMGAGIGMRATQAGTDYQRMATDPSAMQSYMNPYVEASLAPQLQLLNQQQALQNQQLAKQAVSSGAYGGSRQAVAQGLNQQNYDLARQQAIAQGYDKAFQQAQQAQQFGANLGLQGMQTGIQGAQTGLQGIQGALAGTAQGMQGAQIGLQGVQGAQAGYGLANQAAGTLGQLGSAQLAAQQGILGLQNQVGAQQQAYQQQILNQAMQDYANAQQYPLMQLGTMSNMLRGLPLQSSTTQQYIAQPNLTTQAIGTAGALGSLYNAVGRKKGGILEAKKMAKGGIASYDVGGAVEADLYDMPMDRLHKELQSPSAEVRKMARRIMAEKSIEGKAGGGIIAFAGGTPDPEIIPAEPAPQETAADVRYNAQQPAPAPAPVRPMDTSAAGIKRIAAEQYQQNQARANAPTAQLADERAAYVGKDTAGQEYRQKIMAERANSTDEAKRQNWMRAAEFFADWGSRPGNTLAAGMLALKNTIPNVISDEKERKKYERETDKILHELGKAERDERAGNFDKAEERRNKAGEMGWKNLGVLSDIVRTETSAGASLAAAKINAAGRGDTVQDRMVEGYRKQLIANGVSPTDPTLDAQAQNLYFENSGMKGSQLSVQAEGKIAERINGKEFAPLRNELTMANASGDKERIAAAEKAMSDAKAKLRDEIYNSIKPTTPGSSPATPAPAPAAASYTKDSVTVGGQTYTRPDNFTQAQWDAYKKSVGAK